MDSNKNMNKTEFTTFIMFIVIFTALVVLVFKSVVDPYTLIVDTITILLTVLGLYYAVHIYERQKETAAIKERELQEQEERKRYIRNVARFDVDGVEIDVPKKISSYIDYPIESDYKLNLILTQGSVHDLKLSYRLEPNYKLYNLMFRFYYKHRYEFKREFRFEELMINGESFKLWIKDSNLTREASYSNGFIDIHSTMFTKDHDSLGLLKLRQDEDYKLDIPYKYLILLHFYMRWLKDYDSIEYENNNHDLTNMFITDSVPTLILHLEYNDSGIGDHVVSEWRLKVHREGRTSTNFKLVPKHKETRRSSVIETIDKDYGIEYSGNNIPIE